MGIKVIDTSSWSGAVDYEKVKAAGYEGAIIRAGFGNGTLDNEFIGNINRAIDAGIKYIGTFWFGYAYTIEQAKVEAVACHKIIEKYKDWLNLGVYYDWEYDSEDYARKHGVEPTMELVTGMNKAFCEAISSLGYESGYYTNLDYASKYIDELQLTAYRRWLASWGGTQPDHGFLWQYAGDVYIEGIPNKVDKNLLLGAIEAEEPTKDRTQYDITYRVCVEDEWLDWVGDGETAGTQGESKAIEAIQIEGGYAKDILAQYKLYLETTGETNLAKCGEVSGSVGLSRDAQAILIECNVPIKYRAYCQKKKWSKWMKNGEWAGAKGEGLRLEAVQIKKASK